MIKQQDDAVTLDGLQSQYIYIYLSYPYISSTRAHTRLGASQASARRQAFQCRYPRVLGYLGTSWLWVSSSASSSFFSFIFFFTLHPSLLLGPWTMDHGWGMVASAPSAIILLIIINHHQPMANQNPFPFPFPSLASCPFLSGTSERVREREKESELDLELELEFN